MYKYQQALPSLSRTRSSLAKDLWENFKNHSENSMLNLFLLMDLISKSSLSKSEDGSAIRKKKLVSTVPRNILPIWSLESLKDLPPSWNMVINSSQWMFVSEIISLKLKNSLVDYTSQELAQSKVFNFQWIQMKLLKKLMFLELMLRLSERPVLWSTNLVNIEMLIREFSSMVFSSSKRKTWNNKKLYLIYF